MGLLGDTFLRGDKSDEANALRFGLLAAGNSLLAPRQRGETLGYGISQAALQGFGGYQSYIDLLRQRKMQELERQKAEQGIRVGEQTMASNDLSLEDARRQDAARRAAIAADPGAAGRMYAPNAELTTPGFDDARLRRDNPWYDQQVQADAQRKLDQTMAIMRSGVDYRTNNPPPPTGYMEDPNVPGGLIRRPGWNADKPLPAAQVDKLTADAEKVSNLQNLGLKFNDKYAGFVSGTAGNVANWASKVIPGMDESGALWWQEYNRHKNVVRNELFGATLTPSEERAFLEADIHPGMKGDAIRENLRIQSGIIQKALERKANVWRKGGYNPDMIDAATYVEVPASDVDPGRPGGYQQPGVTTSGGDLSPEEQAELEARRARLNGRR